MNTRTVERAASLRNTVKREANREGIIDIRNGKYDIDPFGNSGIHDGLMAALQDSIGTGSGGRGLYIPAGIYLVDETIDFADLTVTDGGIWYWKLQIDPGAQFVGGAFDGPLFRMVPPATKQIALSEISMGRITGDVGQTQTGILSAMWSNVLFTGIHIETCLGDGWLIDQSGVDFSTDNRGFFSNIIHLAAIGTNGNGIVIKAQGSPEQDWNYQANYMQIGQLYQNTGIGIQVEQPGSNPGFSVVNQFVLQDCEGNNIGIQENCGANYWWCSNLVNNTTLDLEYNKSSGANAQSTFHGFFWGSIGSKVNMHYPTGGFPIDIRNYANVDGTAIFVALSVPASNNPQRHIYHRPALLVFGGGLVSDLKVNGISTNQSSGTILLQTGDEVTPVYSAPPTTWYYMFR